MEFGSDLEAGVWSDASRTYGMSLPCLIAEAVKLYRRTPGLDELTRVHLSMTGPEALQALSSVLTERLPGVGQHHHGFIEIRYRLRWHLVRHLQVRLIEDGHATVAMRDDLLGTDLGL